MNKIHISDLSIIPNGHLSPIGSIESIIASIENIQIEDDQCIGGIIIDIDETPGLMDNCEALGIRIGDIIGSQITGGIVEASSIEQIS